MQRQVFRFDPSRGETVLTSWKGANQLDVEAIANVDAIEGVSYDLTFERGIASLNDDNATLNNPIDVWELAGNDERKDLFQNPIWANVLTDDMLALIRQHLDDNDTPTQAFAGGQTPDISGFVGTSIERAYARYQSGNEEFENDAYGGGYVLKHTTNVPARWGVNVADFNVGYVYSTSELISEIGSFALWVYPAPFRLQYKINHIPVPTLREYFRWGWKKSRSNEDTTAHNRVNIVTSYVLEQWSTDDYPGY